MDREWSWYRGACPKPLLVHPRLARERLRIERYHPMVPGGALGLAPYSKQAPGFQPIGVVVLEGGGPVVITS